MFRHLVGAEALCLASESPCWTGRANMVGHITIKVDVQGIEADFQSQPMVSTTFLLTRAERAAGCGISIHSSKS